MQKMLANFDLTGKVGIVTGAASGLGFQHAQTLASAGADVALLARRAERITENARYIEENYGVKALPVVCDVSKWDSVEAAVTQVYEHFGHIEILINNAGVNAFDVSVPESSLEDWDKVIGTNLTGEYYMARAVSKYMIQQNYGKIINISSIGGWTGGIRQLAYHASKGGIINLTRSLTADLSKYNITCNTLGPGVFDTEMTAGKLTHENPNYTHILEGIPMHRIGAAFDLAGAVLFFASDASAYCTGQVLFVDGGKTAVM